MNRKEITEEINQKWFHGAVFAGAVHDPEFQEIAQRFLCGDVTGHGTLTDVQKALIRSSDCLPDLETAGAVHPLRAGRRSLAG